MNSLDVDIEEDDAGKQGEEAIFAGDHGRKAPDSLIKVSPFRNKA
jgi:hypothetical protein